MRWKGNVYKIPLILKYSRWFFMTENKKSLTTNFGRRVDDDQNSVTAGTRGPVLLQDVHLIEKLAHFNRERIPERIVHAKGAGAGGYFEVTKDVTEYTKANFLSQVGLRTEVFARFSTVGGEKGQQTRNVIPADLQLSSTRRKVTTTS